MCISVAPSAMSGTKLYAGEAELNGKYVHVLAYGNTARSLTPRPNAMILPFPTLEAMGPENIIDTRPFPKFLDAYAAAVQPRMRSKGLTLSARGMDGMKSVRVFESGSYTVILAANPADIPAALERVPPSRRPDTNEAIFEAFQILYPGQPVALCCWSGEIKPEPLLWWYEPKDKNTFFLPALDAHDGMPPRAQRVEVDHTLIFGSTINPIGTRADIAGPPPGRMLDLLPPLVQGAVFLQTMPNGDFYLPVKKLQEQRMGVQRIAPAALEDVVPPSANKARLLAAWTRPASSLSDED